MEHINFTELISAKYELKYICDRFIILIQKLESKNMLSEEECINHCINKIKFLSEK